MKIRSRLALRYAAVTAVVFTVFVILVYYFSERARESEFYADLRSEAVTKANLFLSGRVDAEVMQSIYLNNREFIDEVEVAVYTPDFGLVYHDAQQIDIVKETAELIRKAAASPLEFYEGAYQAIAMPYSYHGEDYVVTAAALDGYGIAKRNRLLYLLAGLWLSGIAVSAVAGYYLARRALAPVSGIVREVERISGSNLRHRLPGGNPADELGELSATFNQMLDRLDRSFEAQKMFTANVAHELRTPLSALTSELEIGLLREGRTEEEYRRLIADALSDAQGLHRLITGLLDMAKADYDASQIAMEQVRIDEILLEARETILKASQGCAIELFYAELPEEETSLTASGNRYLLRTAMANLMENNCKYSPNRTSHVHISFFDRKIIVRFSDTGIGMSREEAEKIFEPFYRGANGGFAKGQGLGLHLARKIVLLHRGTLTVNSHPGEGTVFTVELPHI